MCLALRFGFGMGVVLINAFQVCSKSLLEFHGKNLVAFRLIFMAKIRQRFASNATQHTKRYSHQAFDVRIRQQGCPIFMVKIWQSFGFSALQRTRRVLRMCIRRVSTCSHYDESKPSKMLNMLICVAYIGKPMSLGDMDQDNHIAMIMHTIQHEYAFMAIALTTYLYYKVKSSRDQRGSLMQSRESIIQSAYSPIHIQANIYIYIYIHTCIMHNAITQSRKVNQTLPTF